VTGDLWLAKFVVAERSSAKEIVVSELALKKASRRNVGVRLQIIG